VIYFQPVINGMNELFAARRERNRVNYFQPAMINVR